MARQRVLRYCRDAKSSSAMDNMLRVVANTLSNNLFMFGNISFHSVKPLFSLRERLWFIYSVLHCKKGFFFSYTGCPSCVVDELINHHSCQLQRVCSDAFVFTLPKENINIPYVSVINGFLFQTFSFEIQGVGAPYPGYLY